MGSLMGGNPQAVKQILGSNDFTQTSSKQRWSTDGGFTTVVEYKGPLDKVKTKYDSLINNDDYDVVEFSIENGVGVLTVEIQDGNSQTSYVTPELNTVWELDSREIIRDIRTFHDFANYSGTGGITHLEAIRKAAETATVQPAWNDTVDADYGRLLIRGTTEYIRSSMILRSTINAGGRTSVTASWAGVDRAHALASGNGPNPSGTGASAIIGAIQQHPDYIGSKKQWLKRGPRVTQVAKNRFSIVQEWMFSRSWSERLYDGDEQW